MKKILETKRLGLYEFNISDASFILELINSPGWLQNIGDRQIYNLQAAERYIEDGPVKSYAQHSFGLWRIVLKDTAIPVGVCGLIKRPFLDAPDIGYALLPDYEGNGYAIEAAQATINYALQQLHFTKLLAITNADNTRSIQLLEKLGMRFDKTIQLPGLDKEVQLFSSTVAS